MKNQLEFSGTTFEPAQDRERLARQLQAVRTELLQHRGEWYTLRQLSNVVTVRTGKFASEASVSARLRDLRKRRFGGYEIERQRVPNGNGLYRYRMP